MRLADRYIITQVQLALAEDVGDGGAAALGNVVEVDFGMIKDNMIQQNLFWVLSAPGILHQ